MPLLMSCAKRWFSIIRDGASFDVACCVEKGTPIVAGESNRQDAEVAEENV